MDCRQTKELLHDFTDGRLVEPVARDVQRHVAECSDCRVFQQRDRRLQQLLIVKRHETPGVAYFDNFLGEFHQRLAAETAPRVSFWQQLRGQFNLPPMPVFRFGYTHALGAAFALALIWRGLVAIELPASSERQDFAAPLSTPHLLTATLPVTDTDSPVLPVLAQVALNTPRYVLDHIAAAPASYAVASIHF